MKFSEFIKTFNGNLVSVSDNNQYYDKSQASEIAGCLRFTCKRSLYSGC